MVDYLKKFDTERLGVVTHARQHPDKPALITDDKVITYKKLDQDTNSLANTLLKIGIVPGDRISILFHNSPEILKSWSAAGKIGVTPIAINYRFKADELSYIINDSESRLLIYGSEFEDTVSAAKPKLMNRSMKYVRPGGKPPDAFDLDELIRNAPDTPPEVETGLHGVASSLIYTSGTTGRPKGVVRSSKNRLNTLLGYAYNFESTYDDVHIVAGPLYHAAPYAWAAFSLILGNTVVLMPRFDAEEFLRLVQKYRVTTTWIVPTMVNRIINLPAGIRGQYDTSSLRAITVGGESFPFPLKKKAVEFFGPGKIFEFFGGTETSCITSLRPEDQLIKPGSCGKPVAANKIVLLNENMNEVAPGEVGIMYVKSPFLLDGYYKNPEATAANYHNGYFTVGDMARVDEDGYYYIVDRAVDMIISGGVNIYPAEIEEVLYNHPAIYDVGIIGVPDPDWGERIVAYVVAKPGAEISEEDVKEYVGEKLASYKKPKEVYFVEELPYTPSGKLLKRVLREQYKRSA
ncbi:MAG: AMP-binding protein [Proteobacteria bacterium]|nr:AMP-binding protein [Pseudomonadota bacterium]